MLLHDRLFKLFAADHLSSALRSRLKFLNKLLVVIIYGIQFLTQLAELRFAGLLTLVVRFYLLTQVVQLVFHREVFCVRRSNMSLREWLWSRRIYLGLDVLAVVFQFCHSLA